MVAFTLSLPPDNVAGEVSELIDVLKSFSAWQVSLVAPLAVVVDELVAGFELEPQAASNMTATTTPPTTPRAPRAVIRMARTIRLRRSGIT